MTFLVKPKVVAQRKELVFAGVAGRVLSLGGEGELVAGSKDVTVRVDRTGREAERRRRRLGVEVQPIAVHHEGRHRLSTLLVSRSIESRVDVSGVPRVHLLAVFCGEIECVDVALGVVEVVAGRRVDAPHRADHLGAEQDVVDVDDLEEQVDARLVVDAGVEVHVAHEVRREVGLVAACPRARGSAPSDRERPRRRGG